MIKEAYCNNEVSELLKEKGFDWETEHKYWNPHKKIEVKRPTHQMAMRWLREEKHICIEPYCIDQKFMCGFAKFPECMDIDCNQSYCEYDSYEEAVEAALKYCLENLI